MAWLGGVERCDGVRRMLWKVRLIIKFLEKRWNIGWHRDLDILFGIIPSEV